MRLSLRQLQIFRAIALSGSTTAAALSVPLSQSAASAALKELERLLGAQLFDRIGKRLLLNDNGRALLPMALAVLDSAHNLEAAFLHNTEALPVDLRVFASTTIGNYILPALLARFRVAVPAARVELRIGNTLDVVTAVREFATDLGFIEGPCHAQDIIVAPWLEDELVIVAAPSHPLARAARQRKLSFEQLADAQWLLREPGSGTRESVEQALLPHLLNIPASMTLGSSEAIKNAVAEGLGVSCLSRAVVRNLLAAKRLRILATALPRLTRTFLMIHHEKKQLSEPLRKFAAHCRAHA
ncbi:MAG TPA: LysR family transcriptional regulator [Steroidobacteraceae bacterium]|jgi:DNA-binding transcriptional LysR family regulator|nr:LysR family transcriptional regulator [Steroidobacteraceae bacterium]